MNEAFPTGDWQFWVASLVVLVAITVLVKPLLPRRKSSRACPNCTESPARPGRPRRAELTVEGARPTPPARGG